MAEYMDKWGRRTARERYGKSGTGDVNSPPDNSKPQKLGDSANLQGPDHDNDHPNDWVRGEGESAEGRPNFKTSQGYK